MLKKIGTWVVGIVGFGGALVEILNYFHFTAEKLHIGNFLSNAAVFFNYKIPLFVVCIILLLVILIDRALAQKTKPEKAKNIDKISKGINPEQEVILFFLLSTPFKSFNKVMLIEKCGNNAAQFNIAEAELERLGLVSRSNSMVYLTDAGSQVAEKLYKKNSR